MKNLSDAKVTLVARGGFGAKVPLLAARPLSLSHLNLTCMVAARLDGRCG